VGAEDHLLDRVVFTRRLVASSGFSSANPEPVNPPDDDDQRRRRRGNGEDERRRRKKTKKKKTGVFVC